MNNLRLIYRGVLIILHILAGVFLTPLVSTKDDDGVLRTNKRITHWWHARLLRILNVKVTTKGTIPEAPCLVVSNHISWLDIMVLGATMQTGFLSKDDVAKWPVIGWLASRAGTLFIKRGGGETATLSHSIGNFIKQGNLLTLFPEGTTTDGTSVRQFFARLFAVSIDNKLAIAPVGIRYQQPNGQIDLDAPYIGDQSLLENLLILMRREQTLVTVSFAEHIQPLTKDRKSLAKATYSAVMDELGYDLPAEPVRYKKAA